MEEFSEMSSSNEVNSQAQPKNTQTNLEGEQLREAILNQVEFYFSRENLSSDHYLVSNMDNDYYVSLATIANFSKVKALTSDLSLIVDVLSTSKVVSLDDTKSKIKPANISQRSTLILRDMGDATEEDIVALLVSDQLPDPTEIKLEIGSTWCVTYNNKETTLLAISILKQKTFNDKPLRVGIKTENILKSCNMFRIPDNKVPLQYPWVPKGAWMGPSGRGYWDPSFVPDDREKDPNRAGGRGGYKKRKEYPVGSRKPHYSTNNNNNSNNNNNGDKRRPRKKGRDGKKQTPFQLAPAQFPPLPSVKKDRKGGYQSEFIKYSQEEIIKAIQALGELPRPEGFPDDAVVIAEKPNLSLETTKPLPEEDPKTLCDVIKQKPKKDAKPPKRNNNNNNNNNNKSKEEKDAKPAVEKSDHKAEGSPSAPRKKPTWSQIVVPKTNNNNSGAASSSGGAKGKPANKNVNNNNNNNKKNNNSKNENSKNNSNNDKSDDNVAAVAPAAESKNENPNPQVENRAAEDPSKKEESNPSSKDEQPQHQ